MATQALSIVYLGLAINIGRYAKQRPHAEILRLSTKNMEYPVFDGPAFVGYMDEDDCRDILRTRQGRLLRKGNSARVILNPTAKTRSLPGSRSAAISTTQREELYSGLRKEFTDLPMTVNPITVLRRVGDKDPSSGTFEFIDWNERDRFPRRRYNPDLLPRPVRPTVGQCSFVSA